MYHPLSGLNIIYHILLAGSADPHLLILDGENDEKVRRVARGHPRDAAGWHGGLQS